MIAQPKPLIEVFAEIPDFRRRQGTRHPLAAIFSLACCAMLCGYRSYSAIAEWGRNDGTGIAHALGLTHQTPCAATLHTLFRHVERNTLEAQLGAWVSEQSHEIPSRAELDRRISQYTARFAGGPVPTPEHWGGYRVVPSRVEFWQGRPSRLHDRLVYERTEAGGWTIRRLAP